MIYIYTTLSSYRSDMMMAKGDNLEILHALKSLKIQVRAALNNPGGGLSSLRIIRNKT